MMQNVTQAIRRRRLTHHDEIATAAPRAVSPDLQRLTDIVRPYLLTVSRLVHGDTRRRPASESVHRTVTELLERARQQIRKLNLAPQDAEDVHYALVTFADELMKVEPGPLCEYWQSHLLALRDFADTNGGENFFKRLVAIQASTRVDALYVYYLCLLFGFRGIYSSHGALERENLIDSVRRTLHEALGMSAALPLAPSARRPDEPGIDRQQNQLLLGLALGSACVALLWYFGVLLAVDAQQRALSTQLDEAHAALRELTSE